jgi:gas vesicle protein
MYSESYDDRSAGGAGFIMGVMCGTAIGAALGLMFAPKAGSELRQQLSDSTEKLKQAAADTTDRLKRSATEAYQTASERVDDVVARGKEAVERGREEFQSARQQSLNQSSPAAGSSSSTMNPPLGTRPSSGFGVS